MTNVATAATWLKKLRLLQGREGVVLPSNRPIIVNAADVGRDPSLDELSAYSRIATVVRRVLLLFGGPRPVFTVVDEPLFEAITTEVGRRQLLLLPVRWRIGPSKRETARTLLDTVERTRPVVVVGARPIGTAFDAVRHLRLSQPFFSWLRIAPCHSRTGVRFLAPVVELGRRQSRRHGYGGIIPVLGSVRPGDLVARSPLDQRAEALLLRRMSNASSSGGACGRPAHAWIQRLSRADLATTVEERVGLLMALDSLPPASAKALWKTLGGAASGRLIERAFPNDGMAGGGADGALGRRAARAQQQPLE